MLPPMVRRVLVELVDALKKAAIITAGIMVLALASKH